MFNELVIRGVAFRPALFCAPLAGLTHSAFRRVASSFGGCGGFFTEMLSAWHVLREDVRTSPYLKRSPDEHRLIYQLMFREKDPVDRVVDCLRAASPDGLDVNLACHAPNIRQLGAGSRLFEDLPRLERTLREMRACWPGLLTVKIRLGSEGDEAAARFAERMRLFEDCGVDAVTLHPRYFEDKFKRRVRYEQFAWASSLTRLPIIGNGDIDGPETIKRHRKYFASVQGVMIGRMAVAQPWIFAAWNGHLKPNHANIWMRMYEEITADFPPEQALGRLKLFTKYFARNFCFGHHFFTGVQNAQDCGEALARARRFFDANPAIDTAPSMAGL